MENLKKVRELLKELKSKAEELNSFLDTLNKDNSSEDEQNLILLEVQKYAKGKY